MNARKRKQAKENQMTAKEKRQQQKWEDKIDALFEVLDPRNGKTQKESDKAVDDFIDSFE